MNTPGSPLWWSCYGMAAPLHETKKTTYFDNLVMAMARGLTCKIKREKEVKIRSQSKQSIQIPPERGDTKDDGGDSRSDTTCDGSLISLLWSDHGPPFPIKCPSPFPPPVSFDSPAWSVAWYMAKQLQWKLIAVMTSAGWRGRRQCINKGAVPTRGRPPCVSEGERSLAPWLHTHSFRPGHGSNRAAARICFGLRCGGCTQLLADWDWCGWVWKSCTGQA